MASTTQGGQIVSSKIEQIKVIEIIMKRLWCLQMKVWVFSISDMDNKGLRSRGLWLGSG